jgi:hypothetical protein
MDHILEWTMLIVVFLPRLWWLPVPVKELLLLMLLPVTLSLKLVVLVIIRVRRMRLRRRLIGVCADVDPRNGFLGHYHHSSPKLAKE